jgi:ABC-2 type transport system permease protein
MNKILLIISREYLTRVKKRSFVIMSIIGPLLFGALFAVPIWLASRESGEKVVKILDESGYFEGKQDQWGSMAFEYTSEPLDSAKQGLKQDGSLGLLYIPNFALEDPKGITFFSQDNPGIEVQSSLERMLRNEIEEIKLTRSGIDKKELDKLKTDVSISFINLTDNGEKEGNIGLATGLGYVLSFMIYMFVLLYGVQTMRGVIEEKTSRIVEVIISSVKPFQLMMGKIVGVGFVGITQLLIWVVLTFVIAQAVFAIYGVDMAAANEVQMQQAGQVAGGEGIAEVMKVISTINFPLVIVTFIFYFVGGFFFYGSLFAGVGSAVDSDADAQQFQLPVTLPLIASIVILSAIIREPNGSLAFWTSVIPFTSPVIMMMRVPFEPPLWEILLSMCCLILGFLFTTWLAGRIYRVGILMHGTKVNYKILAKWFMMKN